MKLAQSVIGQILCLLTVAILAEDYESELYNNNIESAFESIKDQSPITDDTNLTDWNVISVGTDFNCDLFTKLKQAETVHELTPYDIKVVGALGDSVTAAMGAKASTLLTDLIEYREISWSIGGDKDLSKTTTLPNIIKMYNPDVKGFSTKKLIGRNAYLNVAVSGAIAQDMPSQAKKLVDKIKADSSIDIENDWKLVTLWIGGNNLCSYCNKPDKHSPQNYGDSIKEALDILHAQLPRTFVNLVQIIDITRLAPLKSIVCDIVHSFVCQCVTDEGTSQASTDYQDALNELISSQRYNDRDDFTVVIQPFFIGVELPYENGKPDKSYFAPDCFHFSSKGHREGSVGLWNNMIQPVGEKTTGWELGGDIKCPTADHPYFYTEKNSNINGFSNTHQPDNRKNGNYVAIVTGSTIGVAFFAVFVIIAIAVPMLYKRKRQWTSPEQVQLLNS